MTAWGAAWPWRRALARGRHTARRLAAPYAPDDHDTVAANGHDTAPDLDLAGWQAKLLASIVEDEEKGLYTDRAWQNGIRLADWLRQDCTGATDGQLAVLVMTMWSFIADLAKNTDQANGQYAMARAVILGAFEDSCQTAVLDLTAVARSGA